MAKNISKVYLLSVPLEDDMKNTLYFASASAQHTYFETTIGKTYTNVSYQSESRTFRCPDQIDTVRQYNYLMWQNSAYSQKWFYAFIKKMDYVSDGYTDVVFEVDPLQTYMFNITVKPSFVEREHTNNDTVGNNLVPENLEIGDYVLNGTAKTLGSSTPRYVINTTLEPYVHTRWTAVDTYGLPMAGGLFVFDTWQTMINALSSYNDGQLEAIKQVYTVPSDCFMANDLDMRFDPNNQDDNHMYYAFTGGSTPNSVTQTFTRPTTINGYTPRNKKLLTAPFQSLLMTNNNGTANSLAYEYFTNPSSITIKREGVPTVGSSCLAYPQNYKGVTDNYNESIMCGKYPTLAWSGDTYTNWLTQNAVNIGLGVVSDVAGLLLGGATTALSGANLAQKAITGASVGMNTLESVGSTVSQIYQHSLVPDTITGNTNGGDIVTSKKVNTIYLYPLSIKSQFAAIVDNWFDMFGYKTCLVKIPNVAHRQNWWYTKTVNVNITGNIPNDEMNKIKDAYNNGLTFWTNPANFLDYSVSNGVVS